MKELEFFRSEAGRTPVDDGIAQGDVDGDRTEMDERFHAVHVPRPPQMRADAGHDFARLEGLDDVVVRAGVEAGHAVLDLPAGADDDDGHLMALAHPAANVEAVAVG